MTSGISLREDGGVPSDRGGRYLQSLQRQAADAYRHCQFLGDRMRPLAGWIGAGDMELWGKAHLLRRFFEDVEEHYQRVVRAAEQPPPEDRRARRSQRRELRTTVDEMRRKVDELDRLVLGLEVEHSLQVRARGQRPPEADS
ncbi:hypothetical protein O7599_12770 [Streptomyces sp. WMMC500]|uniref:hypothetical protein n=1 Tax=Streptomyces sp. WMMC500 TaxID=3015154 RepID=UPI00248B1D22|nr:hypothetical protein [Streptomyces sp. WMMC500]WBB63341.1 hypothetical protein O7599_12770 [Streptomyces sp. WMMC500]